MGGPGDRRRGVGGVPVQVEAGKWPPADGRTAFVSLALMRRWWPRTQVVSTTSGAPSSTAGTAPWLESWSEAPPRPDRALARPSRWTGGGSAAALCCGGRRCFGSARGGQGIRGVLQEQRAYPPAG